MAAGWYRRQRGVMVCRRASCSRGDVWRAKGGLPGTAAVVFAQTVIARESSACGPAQYRACLEAPENPPPLRPKSGALGRIEIVLANDRRVIVGHDVDAAVLARVIGALEQR